MDAAAPTDFGALSKLPLQAKVRIVVDTMRCDGAHLIFGPVSIQQMREHWVALADSHIVGHHRHGGLAPAALHAICDRDELAASRCTDALRRDIPYGFATDKFGESPWGCASRIFGIDALVKHLGTKIPDKDYCGSIEDYAARVQRLKSGSVQGELFAYEVLLEGIVEQVRRLLPTLPGKMVKYNGQTWGKGLDTRLALGPEADLTIHLQSFSLAPDKVGVWEAEVFEVVDCFVGWDEDKWLWEERKIELRLKAQRLMRLVGRLRLAAAWWQSELRIRRRKRTIGSVDQDF